MFRLVLVSGLVALVAGATSKIRPIVPMLDGRIVGGEDADITEVPYQLSLRSWNMHICGASILSATRALTAARCTSGASASSLSIRAGSTYRRRGGQIVKVSEIAQHPWYRPLTADYDVSVLILASSLTLGPAVQPVALHRIGDELAVGTLALLSGWGFLSLENATFPSVLQKVSVPKVSDEACRNVYGWAITDRMTCHGFDQGGQDSCQGDFGGPLVAEGVQVGIASWGAVCGAPKIPGVYTKVSNHEIKSFLYDYLE